MREVPLTKGLIALVDDEDYDHVMTRKWRANLGEGGKYYARSGGPYNIIMMPNFILNVSGIVDHKNTQTLDNRRCNLRPATPALNCANMRKTRGNSKYKGVWFDGRRWRAHIRHNYKRLHLGTFDTEIEAAQAYDRKAQELWGEFARLNFQ